jgi:hypothetical protein
MFSTMIRSRFVALASSYNVPKRTYIESVYDNTDNYESIPMAWTRVANPKVKVRTEVIGMTGHGLTIFTRKRCAMYDKDKWTNSKVLWHMPSYVRGVTRINPFQLLVFGQQSYWLSRVLKSYVYFCDLDKQTCVPLHRAGRGGTTLDEAVSRVPYKRYCVAPMVIGTTVFMFGTPPRPQSFLIPPTGVAVFDIVKREPFRELTRAELRGPIPEVINRCFWDDLTRKFFLVTYGNSTTSVTGFDPATLTFDEPIPMSSARFRSSYAMSFIRDANNNPYIVYLGGVLTGPLTQVHVPDVDLFDIKAGVFKVGKFDDDSPFPLPRRDPAACVASPHTVAFGGGRTHFFDQNDIWILSFTNPAKK